MITNTAYNRLKYLNSGAPLIRIKDNKAYITNGCCMAICDAEGYTNIGDKEYNTNINTKVYTKVINLPTVKEIRAEIKARQVKYSNKSDLLNMYELTPGFFVNIFYLLDAVSNTGSNTGKWDGNITKHSTGKWYSPSGLYVQGNDIEYLILPILSTDKHREITYPTPKEKPILSKHITDFAKRISIEDGKLVIMNDGTAIIRLNDLPKGIVAENSNFSRFIKPQSAVSVDLPTMKEINDYIKAKGINRKKHNKSKLCAYKLADDLEVNIFDLKDIIQILGNDVKAYWSGEIMYLPDSCGGGRAHKDMLYFKSNVGEACNCLMKLS